VTSAEIIGLGAVAGFTIYLGLPIGRLRSASPRLRASLNAVAIGILLFLLWDVLTHAIDPIEQALPGAAGEHPSWGRFSGLVAVFAVGLGVGLVSLVYYDEWMARRRTATLPVRSTVPSGAVPSAAVSSGAVSSGAVSSGAVSSGAVSSGGVSSGAVLATEQLGPGAGSVVARPGRGVLDLADPTHRLALLIAVGIGLHSFSEGLAIGQSAAAGQLSLAVLLIIGFGLHNATEGFGIVGPMAAAGQRPGWGMLGLLGLIGGGPTFLGTAIGQSFVNETIYLGFLALAAGSILYVVIQLLKVAAKLGVPRALYWGLLTGLFAGFATDFVVTAAGA
jgi:ZIP family zinc transporter